MLLLVITWSVFGVTCQEVNSVFALYNITVDRRHLSLIADYMTFEGRYKPFSRLGLETNTSPLQKMSFETAMQFLRSSVVDGMHTATVLVVVACNVSSTEFTFQHRILLQMCEYHNNLCRPIFSLLLCMRQFSAKW